MTFISSPSPCHVRRSVWLSFTLSIATSLAACQSAPPPPRIVAQTLVISRWEHRLVDDRAFGIDLDGVTSMGEGGCTEAWDYRHVTDPREGIDNQYAGFLLAALQGFDTEMPPVTDRVTAELEAGRSLYGLRITPSAEDDTVEVVLLSFAATGALPRRVAAQASDGSLTATEITSTTARRTALGLRVSVPIPVAIPFGESLGEREIEDVELELVMDADGVVRRGDFAGAVPMATVMEVAEALSPVPVAPGDLERFAEPDLRPDERGGDCGAVSIGLGLELVELP